MALQQGARQSQTLLSHLPKEILFNILSYITPDARKYLAKTVQHSVKCFLTVCNASALFQNATQLSSTEKIQ